MDQVKRSRKSGFRKGSDWVYHAPGEVQRIEAYFSGTAYAPHRHDTYAIGITLAGVQSFNYQGMTRNSLPGQVVVIHPDECHDGRAGTEEGFLYRVIYLEPAKIQGALGGKPLPFIKEGVSADPKLHEAVAQLLSGYDRDLEPLAFEDGVFEVAAALDRAADDGPKRRQSFDLASAEMARTYLMDHLEDQVTLDDLETVSGHNRWKLSRDFRALYGTSPYRYLIMRRLDRVKEKLLMGAELADVAYDCQFADQSHMNRHFKKAFGMTPKQWLQIQKTQAT